MNWPASSPRTSRTSSRGSFEDILAHTSSSRCCFARRFVCRFVCVCVGATDIYISVCVCRRNGYIYIYICVCVCRRNGYIYICVCVSYMTWSCTVLYRGVTPDEMVVRHIRQNELTIQRMKASEAKCGRQIEKQIIGKRESVCVYVMWRSERRTYVRTLVFGNWYVLFPVVVAEKCSIWKT